MVLSLSWEAGSTIVGLSKLRERLRGEQRGKIFVVDVPVAIVITSRNKPKLVCYELTLRDRNWIIHMYAGRSENNAGSKGATFTLSLPITG
jgi:hypothetical protein